MNPRTALLAIALIGVLPPAAVATNGTKTATSVVVTSGSWFSSGSAGAKDHACATPADSGTLSLSKYGFSLASDAKVTGIQVTTWVSADNFTGTEHLTLFAGGSSSAAQDVAFGAATGCGNQSQSFGGEGVLWGLTPTATDVNSTAVGGFGVRVAGANPNGSGVFAIDAAQITVYYFAAPTTLVASSQQNGVHLTWVDPNSDESSFSLERDDGLGGTFNEIATPAANATSADDSTAVCERTYNYRLRAFRSSDTLFSNYSGTASVVHHCPNLTVAKSTSSSAVVTGAPWTWTLLVINAGARTATLSVTQALLSDALPAGPAYGTPAAVAGGGASGTIACAIASGILSCTASTGVTLPVNGTFTITVPASSGSLGTFTNGSSNCAIDPGGVLVESDETDNGCNASAVEVSVKPLPGPTGLAAVSRQNEVRLTWVDNATDESGYQIERDDGLGGGLAQIATTGANATAFDDSTAVCDRDYQYRVRAFRTSDDVQSVYSATVPVSHHCPDLMVTKSSSADVAIVGTPWTWTLTVSNVGSGPATLAASQGLLSDVLPSGPAYSHVTVTPDPAVTGTLACTITSGTLGCSAIDTVVVAASSTVVVTVDGNSAAPADLTNGASACAADPGHVLVESLETNNACNPSPVSVRSETIFDDGFEDGALPGAWGGVG